MIDHHVENAEHAADAAAGQQRQAESQVSRCAGDGGVEIRYHVCRLFDRLDRKSSRGMLYENEELRLKTININAEIERGECWQCLQFEG